MCLCQQHFFLLKPKKVNLKITYKTNKMPQLNMRAMFCELNALTRADGSALLTQGLAKIKYPCNCMWWVCNKVLLHF